MEQRFLRSGPVQPEAREGPPPFVRRLLRGLGRFTMLVVVAAGVSAGVGLLIGWWKGSDLAEAANLGLYVGGAVLVAVPLFSADGQSVWGWGQMDVEISAGAESRWQRQKRLGMYLVVGVLVLALGLLVQSMR